MWPDIEIRLSLLLLSNQYPIMLPYHRNRCSALEADFLDRLDPGKVGNEGVLHDVLLLLLLFS